MALDKDQTLMENKREALDEQLLEEIQSIPDEELLEYLHGLDEDQRKKAFTLDQWLMCRTFSGNIEERLNQFPEDFVMELLMQYLIRYCTPRNYEHHLTVFFEPRLRKHAPGLKAIWDKTEHQKVRDFLGQLTAGYYAEAAEYVLANNLWTDHSKHLTGFSAKDIENRRKELKK